MSSAGYGAIAGAGLGLVSNVMSLKANNKSVISSIEREGSLLASNMQQININRTQLDRELGDILSSNALATAKNMATAKILMSTSGTIGGTTSRVSKQAYIDQLQADADVISKARNSEIGLLNEAVSRRMQFRLQSNALRSSIASPESAFMTTLSAMLNGASGGATMGQNVEGAMGTSSSQRMDVRNSGFSSYLMSQG